MHPLVASSQRFCANRIRKPPRCLISRTGRTVRFHVSFMTPAQAVYQAQPAAAMPKNPPRCVIDSFWANEPMVSRTKAAVAVAKTSPRAPLMRMAAKNSIAAKMLQASRKSPVALNASGRLSMSGSTNLA